MKLNLYLPDEIGSRAKEAELPLSQLLRAAVESELDRIDAHNALEDKMSNIELPLENDNGDVFVGEFTGTLLADDGRHQVYATDDERVLLYDNDNLRYWEIDEPETELRDQLNKDDYLAVMRLLGLKARVAI